MVCSSLRSCGSPIRCRDGSLLRRRRCRRASAPRAPARPTRRQAAASSNDAKHLCQRYAEAPLDRRDRFAPGKGGTLSCRFASSSANSVGSRSRRVDRIWPNLMNTGPSDSIASRESPRRRIGGLGSQRVGDRRHRNRSDVGSSSSATRSRSINCVEAVLASRSWRCARAASRCSWSVAPRVFRRCRCAPPADRGEAECARRFLTTIELLERCEYRCARLAARHAAAFVGQAAHRAPRTAAKPSSTTLVSPAPRLPNGVARGAGRSGRCRRTIAAQLPQDHVVAFDRDAVAPTRRYRRTRPPMQRPLPRRMTIGASTKPLRCNRSRCGVELQRDGLARRVDLDGDAVTAIERAEPCFVRADRATRARSAKASTIARAHSAQGFTTERPLCASSRDVSRRCRSAGCRTRHGEAGVADHLLQRLLVGKHRSTRRDSGRRRHRR